MRYFPLLPILALVLAAAPTAAQEVVTLEPTRDATLVESSDGSLALGASSSLFVGRINRPEESIRRGMLHFDVASVVPRGARILQVRLVLTQYSRNEAPADVRLHRVLADWGEGSSFGTGGSGAPAEPGDATWLHRFFDQQHWTHAGGQFVGRPSATTVVAGPGIYTVRSPGMTRDVQRWLVNPRRNFGWILLGNETAPQTVKQFASRENPEASLRPVLEITYTARRGR